MADALVLNCLVTHDRPFNVQAVADLLATKGVKKPQAQRSLDALAQAKKIRVKVYDGQPFQVSTCSRGVYARDVLWLQLRWRCVSGYNRLHKQYLPTHHWIS